MTTPPPPTTPAAPQTPQPPPSLPTPHPTPRPTSTALTDRYVRLSQSTPFPDQVRALLDGIGSTLLAYTANVRSRTSPHYWTNNPPTTPTDAAQQRVTFAYRCLLALTDSDGPVTARNFLIGTNPRTGDDTPLSYIRLGTPEAYRQVWTAVLVFINDENGY